MIARCLERDVDVTIETCAPGVDARTFVRGRRARPGEVPRRADRVPRVQSRRLVDGLRVPEGGASGVGRRRSRTSSCCRRPATCATTGSWFALPRSTIDEMTETRRRGLAHGGAEEGLRRIRPQGAQHMTGVLSAEVLTGETVELLQADDPQPVCQRRHGGVGLRDPQRRPAAHRSSARPGSTCSTSNRRRVEARSSRASRAAIRPRRACA